MARGMPTALSPLVGSKSSSKASRTQNSCQNIPLLLKNNHGNLLIWARGWSVLSQLVTKHGLKCPSWATHISKALKCSVWWHGFVEGDIMQYLSDISPGETRFSLFLSPSLLLSSLSLPLCLCFSCSLSLTYPPPHTHSHSHTQDT